MKDPFFDSSVVQIELNVEKQVPHSNQHGTIDARQRHGTRAVQCEEVPCILEGIQMSDIAQSACEYVNEREHGQCVHELGVALLDGHLMRVGMEFPQSVANDSTAHKEHVSDREPRQSGGQAQFVGYVEVG